MAQKIALWLTAMAAVVIVDELGKIHCLYGRLRTVREFDENIIKKLGER